MAKVNAIRSKEVWLYSNVYDFVKVNKKRSTSKTKKKAVGVRKVTGLQQSLLTPKYTPQSTDATAR